MSYQVIARKYRPQRFSDVVGQDHVTQTLGNAIRQNRIAHAYLFVGPRGTGKTTMARIFAKCLNATNGPTVDFSDDDPRCKEITDGRSLDVLEIDGASNRGIEEVRELRETVKYAPATSRFKVYIIDEVHMLTKEAFNALLKTLEEPPPHVKFMFATTEVEKVLPTILSRCQRFDLRRIPTKLIVGHLASIASKEGVQIDETALYALARGADGGMRDAESTLDQLISFCGSEIREADVLSMFGLAAREQVAGLVSCIINGDVAGAIRLLDELARGGKDLSRLLGDLLAYFRNLLVFLASKGDLSLLEVSEAEAGSIRQQSASLSFQAVAQIMDVLTDAEGRLREVASKKILFEVTLLKAVEAKNALSIDSVLQRLNELRSEASTPGSSAPAPAASRVSGYAPPASAPIPAATASAPAPAAPTTSLLASYQAAIAPTPVPPPSRPQPAPIAPAPVPASSPAATELPPAAAPASVALPGMGETPDLEAFWQGLLEQVGKASPFAKTYLVEAYPISLASNLFTIGLDPEFSDHLSLMDNAKTRTLLQTKLSEAGFHNMNVKFVLREAPAGRARPAAPAPEPLPAAPAAPAARPAPGARAASGEAKPAAAPADKAPASKPLALTKDDFKNDPLIRQALEIFKGQIVDVRGV